MRKVVPSRGCVASGRLAGLLVFAALMYAIYASLEASAIASNPRFSMREGRQYIVVTRDSRTLSYACSPRSVATVVADLFRAITVADEARLRDILGRDFERFSLSEGKLGHLLRQFATHDREEAVQFLLHRHEQTEVQRLVMATVYPPPRREQEGGIAGVVFYVKREARDLEPGLGGKERLAQAKAGVSCSEHRVIRLNMAMELVDPRRTLPPNVRFTCPKPAGWTLRQERAVACSDSGKRPMAQEATPRFAVTLADPGLSPPCRSDAAGDRVLRALRAFNLGWGMEFARTFQENATIRLPKSRPRQGRVAIGRLAVTRHREREGWEAASLQPPDQTQSPLTEALLDLRVQVKRVGRVAFSRDITIRVSCTTGLFLSWTAKR